MPVMNRIRMTHRPSVPERPLQRQIADAMQPAAVGDVGGAGERWPCWRGAQCRGRAGVARYMAHSPNATPNVACETTT
jgi:hypothetical protein